jgi:hypothetical protein
MLNQSNAILEEKKIVSDYLEAETNLENITKKAAEYFRPSILAALDNKDAGLAWSLYERMPRCIEKVFMKDHLDWVAKCPRPDTLPKAEAVETEMSIRWNHTLARVRFRAASDAMFKHFEGVVAEAIKTGDARACWEIIRRRLPECGEKTVLAGMLVDAGIQNPFR